MFQHVMQARQYLAGAVYIKQLHHLINMTESQDSNCTLTGWFVSVDNASISNNTAFYQYECTQVYRVWGYFTIFFLFVPGISTFLLGSSYTRYLIKRKRYSWLENKFCRNLVLLMISIATTFTFPVQYIAINIISLLEIGSEWKKFSSKVVIADALMHRTLQYGLTLYILFDNADQEARFIQKFGLTINMFFMSLARIDACLCDEGGAHMGWKRKVVETLPLLPLSITNILFKLSSMSFIIVILGYNDK